MIGANFAAKTASQTTIVAPMKRIPYAEASRALLRDSVLDAMRDLLLPRDWSAITLSDVARAAGISRQTIYNEFGSRQGLAQGYALRLADRLVERHLAETGTHPGTVGLVLWGTAAMRTAGDDVAEALVRTARQENVTQIVLGASRRTRWAELMAQYRDPQAARQVA